MFYCWENMGKLNDDKSASEVPQSTTEDSENDSAPEEVTFSAGQKDALSSMKSVQSYLEKNKAKLKEERRKLHARNISQKEEKRKRLKELESKKLPDDILQQLVANEAKSLPMARESLSHKKITKNREKVIDEKQTESYKNESEDFISLSGTTEFHVAVLEKEMNKPKAIAEKAFEFKRQQLFGKRVRREPVQSLIAKREKRIVAGHIKS